MHAPGAPHGLLSPPNLNSISCQHLLFPFGTCFFAVVLLFRECFPYLLRWTDFKVKPRVSSQQGGLQRRNLDLTPNLGSAISLKISTQQRRQQSLHEMPARRPQHATRIARRGPMPVTQRPSLPCARGPIVSGVQGRNHQPRWIDLRRQPLTGDDDTVDNRSTMQDLVNTATLASTTTPPHQEPPSIILEPVAHRQIPRG